jgi:hypothetical protein
MSDPIKAEVFARERRDPAVDCTFSNARVRRIGVEAQDWPILLKLERAGS